MTNSFERRRVPREPSAHSRLHEGDGTPRGNAAFNADARSARPDLAAAAAASGAAATTGNYARFIPREEVHSFAAWTPGSFGNSTTNGMPAAAAAAPEPALTAELLAAQTRAARQAGYHDGYRDGLVALEGFKQTYAQQMTSQVGTLVHNVRGQLEQVEQGLAKQVAEIAIALARQIVRSELATRPELVAAVAGEALAATLAAAKQINLHLHPDDQSLVQQHNGEALAARDVRLLPDPAVTRGGCVIDTDVGIIDASVEARWRRATATMGRASNYVAPESKGRLT